MKSKQAGLSFIEVIIATFVGIIIVSAAYMVISNILTNSRNSNNHMTVISNLEHASYWISKDTQTAETVQVDGLTSPAILVLSWMVPGYETASVYHSVTYSIEDISEGIGTLVRCHENSIGTQERQNIAEHVYYSADDHDGTTCVDYESPKLVFKLAMELGETQESKEFEITRRTNY